MKRLVKVLLVICLAVFIVAGCAETVIEYDILVVSRESGSGTRDAFDGMVKNAAGDSLAKLADGTARDAIVETADFQSSTNNVITKVSSSKTAIGYISLGSLNDEVKALTVGGITASAANVLNGTYTMQRPFVLMTNKTTTLTAATADFYRYLESSDAQDIVGAKLVQQTNESQVTYTAPASALSGTIVVRGSTSVDPYMDLLIADYKTLGGANVASIEFDKDAQGSSAGISAAKADTTGNVIGMSSSAIKSADQSSLVYFTVALDAIAVIVNKENVLTNITIAELYSIYTGEVTKFSVLS